MLSNDFIKEDFHFTAYATTSYLKLSQKARGFTSNPSTITLDFRHRAGELQGSSRDIGQSQLLREEIQRQQQARKRKTVEKQAVEYYISSDEGEEEDSVAVSKKQREVCEISSSEEESPPPSLL